MNLGEKKDIYEDFFNRIHDFIYQTDLNDEIIIANPALVKLFAYESVKEITGMDVKKTYVNTDDRDKLKKKLRESGGSVTDYSIHVKKKTGEKFWISVDSRIIENEKGEEVGIEGIGRDVTKREVELQKIIEERDRFFMDVSHEMRTPMATIFATAENIQKGITPESKIKNSLNKIVTELQRLNLLAERFWRAELITKGILEYRPSKVNIYEIISNCRKLMLSLAQRKKIDIKIDDKIKRWGPLTLDRKMFMHTILNLLDNAIKYSFAYTFVKIYGERYRTFTELVVQNLGIEISPDEQTKIFERYYRTKKAISIEPTGSGVGLMIVKDFTEKHDGKIKVESIEKKEKGPYLNSFSLIFPK